LRGRAGRDSPSSDSLHTALAESLLTPFIDALPSARGEPLTAFSLGSAAAYSRLMIDSRSLADDYLGFRQSTEALRLLRGGQTANLDRWDDLAPAAVTARQNTLQGFADAAEELIVSAEADDRILLETVAFTARSAARLLDWRVEHTLVNPAMGLHATLLTFIGRFSLVTAEQGVEYHTKLERLPGLLRQVGSQLVASAEVGNVALTRHLLASADSIDAYIAGPAGEADPLAVQAPPRELNEAEAAGWRATSVDIVATTVRPAMAAYADTLRALADRGRPDDQAGWCHLDGGRQMYRDHVWAHTSVDLSPEEIHQIGLDVIESLEAEYLQVAGPVLSLDEISAIYTHLRDDASMRYGHADDLVRDATTALARAAEVAPSWFNSIPMSECIAAATPNGALAYYAPPEPTTGNPGRFYFNTANLAAWSTYQIEAITFHEAIPGHHLQIAGFFESTTLHPAQIRFGINAYLEGWGLYTERLADEMGLYSSELARVGMLAADSMRACRLVVDTGIHALGWSRQQAIDYFVDHSPLSLALIEGEVDRYIGVPGQALSYMIGRLEIDAIRTEAAQRDDFDIKAFHDKILRNGMITLPTLRRVVLDD